MRSIRDSATFHLPILENTLFPGDRTLQLPFAETPSSQLGKSDYKTALFCSHEALFLQKFSNDLSTFHSCDKINQTKGKGDRE